MPRESQHDGNPSVVPSPDQHLEELRCRHRLSHELSGGWEGSWWYLTAPFSQHLSCKQQQASQSSTFFSGWEGAGRTAPLKADLLEEVAVGGVWT